ncbi:MAG: sugar ABC transporter ATP-binding protein [Acidobacteriota bacterium]|nr:sugar ABC transporter ATP-binding protein [Acidobacteriota bacterium]
MADLLRAHGISKHYGGVYALKEAHFTLHAGEIHALMGENGAGKSTLSKILAGAIKPGAGSIEIDGKNAAIASPLDAQRLGIGIIYQELDLFPNLSVAENIVTGNLHFRERAFVNARASNAFCRPFLEQVGLECQPTTLVASLSVGQRQLVAIARALSMNARVILMDEPTSSLFDDAAERLFRLIVGLKASGVSIVYVSHKMDEIFRICDRITVLRDGATVGTRETLATGMDEVIHMMVGRELMQPAHTPRRPGEVVLSVENLTTGKLRGISFALRRGEVLGVAGLVGSGRSELGAALFGLDSVQGGHIRLKGDRIGLVPEDRKLQGLMMQMSVLENATMAAVSRFAPWGFVRRERERAALLPLAEKLALRYSSASADVSSLSGGNQQKALLARWLLVNPDVLFLDDPARGIDVGAKQDIYRIVDELAASGKGVIFVSSELPELLRCCDRILVLNQGRLTGEFDAADATQDSIMTAATTAATTAT